MSRRVLMNEEDRTTNTVFTNIIGKTGSIEGIMLCLRFLAVQAVSQGRMDLANDIEALLEDYEYDMALEKASDSATDHFH